MPARENRRTALIAITSLALSLAAGPLAQAQDYPNRSVKVVVPFPAGGTADAMPRLVADYLSRKWNQPVIIENKPGAAGNIGSEQVFKADPDGYTLLSTPQPPLVMNLNLYPSLPYDPAQFVPIAMIARVPSGLLVNPQKVPQKTLAEIIAYAKANPGKLTSATQGNGTTSHLTSEMFQMMAGVKVQHVPYRGSAPALQDLVSGSVDLMFDNLGSSLPLVQGGQLKLIAVATKTRMKDLPNVPTIAETLPGFESAAWFSFAAPPKTPREIVMKINAGVNEALQQPDIQAKIAKLSGETLGGTPEDMSAYMKEEIERWHKVIKAANVKLN